MREVGIVARSVLQRNQSCVELFHGKDTEGRNPPLGSQFACSGVTVISSLYPWGIPMIRNLVGARPDRDRTLTTR